MKNPLIPEHSDMFPKMELYLMEQKKTSQGIDPKDALIQHVNSKEEGISSSQTGNFI